MLGKGLLTGVQSAPAPGKLSVSPSTLLGSRPHLMRVELPKVPIGVRVRYKLWRSNKDKQLHLLCAEGSI
jgi:hypothetical protein